MFARIPLSFDVDYSGTSLFLFIQTREEENQIKGPLEYDIVLRGERCTYSPTRAILY